MREKNILLVQTWQQSGQYDYIKFLWCDNDSYPSGLYKINKTRLNLCIAHYKPYVGVYICVMGSGEEESG